MNSLRRVSVALRLLPLLHGARIAVPGAATAAALLFAGCGPAPTVEVAATPAPVPDEIDAGKKKIADSEKEIAARDTALAAANEALKAANLELAEKQQVITQRDAQIKTAQAELEAAMKRDTVVFGEIRATQRRGGSLVALESYRRFLRDYPTSALVPDVEAAITELTNESALEADRQADLFEPARRERQQLELLREGLLTPSEMAPLFRRKSRTQVIKLLGKPNINFPDGAEIGYNDRGTNPATGKKGMLIVSFEDDEASALRVDYAGRPLKL